MSDPQTSHPVSSDPVSADPATSRPETFPAPGAPAASSPEHEASAEPSDPGRKRRRRRRGRRREGADASAPEAASARPAAPVAPAEADEDAPEVEEVERPEREARAVPPREYADSERPSAATVRDDGAPADIDPARLDVEGLKILNRLHRFGHQAYFVGGCVRDLLLDRPPKDFDIATSANPSEVRSLFRNCRLIGKRFRLAHVFFRGGKIIEVSTFRANPTEPLEAGEELPEDLLITRDNVFGNAEQDALRRDFTINGLFYDIRLGRVIDYANGLPDLKARTLRTIGSPEVRMREDPVRILRAVRFASRLEFDIDPATWEGMERAAPDLARCAPARVLEEVLRLLRSGYSRRAFDLLHSLGALKLLLPPVGEHLERTGTIGVVDLLARLGALDLRVRKGGVDDSLIIAAMLTPLARSRSEESEDMSPGEVVDGLLDDMVQTARLPRRLGDRVRMLLWAQGVLSGERKRRRSLSSFRKHPIFPDSFALLQIGAEATGQHLEMVQRWRDNKGLDQPPAEAAAASGAEASGEAAKRKRRRRRGGGRRGGQDGAPPAPSSSEPAA